MCVCVGVPSIALYSPSGSPKKAPFYVALCGSSLNGKWFSCYSISLALASPTKWGRPQPLQIPMGRH